MKIEVWSDYVCPFCYIGKRRLEQALQATNLKDHAEVVFKSYQLDPNSPETTDEKYDAILAAKYGTSVEQARQMTNNVAEQAKTVGLDYNFDEMKPSNTKKAHQLAKWAATQGKEAELTERLLAAHFLEGQSLGKTETLLDLAEEVGLNREEALESLSNDLYAKEVYDDIQEAMAIGVQGVPFFVINRKYAISGAQPNEVFENALKKVADEEGIQPKFQTFGDATGAVCTDDSCK